MFSNPPVEADQRVILLVDDDANVRRIVRAILSSAGYLVLVASDCDEALQTSDQYGGPIQLLLTDIRMPLMDAFKSLNGLMTSARRPRFCSFRENR